MCDDGRPEWWKYPLTCPHGQRWAPGLVIVGWMPCDCPGARTEPGRGHLWVRCRAADCPGIWYRPEHTAPADTGLPSGRSGRYGPFPAAAPPPVAGMDSYLTTIPWPLACCPSTPTPKMAPPCET